MIPKLIEPGIGLEGAREILMRGEEFLLGRGTDCDLRLSDVNVSRHHCLIRIRREEITLADMGSSNGTFVNGQRIVSQTVLKPGDEIRVGEFRFIFEIGQATRSDSDQTLDPLAHTFKLGDVNKMKDE